MVVNLYLFYKMSSLILILIVTVKQTRTFIMHSIQGQAYFILYSDYVRLLCRPKHVHYEMIAVMKTVKGSNISQQY